MSQETHHCPICRDEIELLCQAKVTNIINGKFNWVFFCGASSCFLSITEKGTIEKWNLLTGGL